MKTDIPTLKKHEIKQRVGNTEIKNFCLLNFQEKLGGNSRWVKE